MKIGCCGTTEDYLLIRSQGYDYIELSARQLMSLTEEEFRRFLGLYRRLGFPCRGFNSLCGPELPLVGPEQDMTALRAYLDELCRRGQELGIESIGVGAPGARRPPADWPTERSDGQMRDFLRMACETAAPRGIDILLEAVNSYICGYLHTTEHAAALAGSLDCANLGLVLDYYQVRLMGEDPRALGYAMPLVRHLHVSGGEPHAPRLYPVSPEDEAEQRVLRACAREQGYGGGSVSVEADRRFLREEGAACAALMRRVWGA